MNTYGCFNRKPIQTFGANTCQYTRSPLGQTDKRCDGCKERNPTNQEMEAAFDKHIASARAMDAYNDKGKKWSDRA